MEIDPHFKIKPPLRWAGGKNWLTKIIHNHLPEKFGNYYEPFLGGGAIVLHLLQHQFLKNDIFLSDSNPKVIEFYKVLQDYPSELILRLNNFKNTPAEYYKERNTRYPSLVDRAAQFLYLNRTSFNGIYRENLNGDYNVPYGFKEYKNLFDFNLLNRVSSLIKKARFDAKDFTKVKPMIKPNDLIFLDPPYTVSHQNNGFIKYNQKIFSWEDQIRLRELVDHISDRGAYFILTNAYHSSILTLYDRIGNHHILERASLVGGKNAVRAKYKEVLITNVQ